MGEFAKAAVNVRLESGSVGSVLGWARLDGSWVTVKTLTGEVRSFPAHLVTSITWESVPPGTLQA